MLKRDKPDGTLKGFMENNGANFFTDVEIIKTVIYGEIRIKSASPLIALTLDNGHSESEG